MIIKVHPLELWRRESNKTLKQLCDEADIAPTAYSYISQCVKRCLPMSENMSGKLAAASGKDKEAIKLGYVLYEELPLPSRAT